ncbi:MAG: hypothetical protein GTN89_13325 [Acidobacteria bacterium]|nr:hypothetical protein [Acidobacteriota bacterium]NIM60228.1 hypothetical protein [Acidobacteriota bacterium]NIO60266.1 hypothetical protein [Acidobacteriota bacterium]NIQ31321.1 hypothetical protein [Acidobacteriota bacterium]NIQ86544.1 hypothetical protein [Acidobacteriota bacterium]
MQRTRSFPVTCLILLLSVGLPTLAGHRSRQPDRSFQVRLGGFFLDGDGPFWADNESIFTLDASDFDNTTVGLTYSHGFNRFFELDVNADFTNETVVSEYRDFVDGSGFPILHDSTLRTTPMTVGMRFLPLGRAGAGKSKPVFFLGAGGGVNFWTYEEFGDFIDFSDPANPIILGDFRETGEAFVSYGVIGLELPLSPSFNLGFEARHFSSDDELKGDFAGLGKLDMGGWAGSVSANWRF